MTASSPRILSLWLILLLILIAMVTQVTSRPSPRKRDSQVLQDLFGSQIHSLLLNQPEIAEGSAQSPTPSHNDGRGLSGHSMKVEVRPLKDFLSRQRKWRGRSRKGFGRGCFGMKVDRIGALSGLGC